MAVRPATLSSNPCPFPLPDNYKVLITVKRGYETMLIPKMWQHRIGKKAAITKIY